MALQKQLAIRNTGITANYIKLDNAHINVSGNYLTAQLYIYKDKDARDTGKGAIDSIDITINNLDQMPLLGNGLVAVIYTHIKSLPELQGALDV